MNNFLKILLTVCFVLALGGFANAESRTNVNRTYDVAYVTKTSSLFKQLAVRWNIDVQYLSTPLVGRNKYGFPVPVPPVMTAKTNRSWHAFR